jgi:hypothetical protein
VAVVSFACDTGEVFTERRPVLGLEVVSDGGLHEVGYLYVSEDVGLVGSVSSIPWRGADSEAVSFELDGRPIPVPSVPALRRQNGDQCMWAGAPDGSDGLGMSASAPPKTEAAS